MTEVKTRWLNDLTFESSVGNQTILMDADPKVGGHNRGSRPKPLLLAALAGCTGMDVVSLLNKMRVAFRDFQIDVQGELTHEHPKYYHKIRIIYILKGKDIDRSKVEKAVSLSQDKYCGVSAMLCKAAEITFEIRIEEE